MSFNTYRDLSMANGNALKEKYYLYSVYILFIIYTVGPRLYGGRLYGGGLYRGTLPNCDISYDLWPLIKFLFVNYIIN